MAVYFRWEWNPIYWFYIIRQEAKDTEEFVLFCVHFNFIALLRAKSEVEKKSKINEKIFMYGGMSAHTEMYIEVNLLGFFASNIQWIQIQWEEGWKPQKNDTMNAEAVVALEISLNSIHNSTNRHFLFYGQIWYA